MSRTYVIDITWANGRTETRTETSTFIATQKAYWERYGAYGRQAEVDIVSAKVREEAICTFCESAITHSTVDGAWEDESGACGCGDGEHLPGSADAPFLKAAHDERYTTEFS